ncbi:hypothetical protein SME46J_13120 [Serratia marcescens]|nr:hypothetical protein SME46J_13120 [Serratia marcescens]
MAKNEFLPFGTAANANVLPNADYQALPARSAGFSSGVAKSEELNTVWRQGSTMAAVLGQFIADKTGQDVLDDGDVTKLTDGLDDALEKKVIAGFPSELSINGYQKLPSGLVQQWGRSTVTTDAQGNLSITPPGNNFADGIFFGRVDLGESSYAGVSRVIIINTYPNTTKKSSITACARYADNGAVVANTSINVTFEVLGS